MPKTLEKPQNLRVEGEPTDTTINMAWDHSGGKPLDGFYLSWRKQGEPGWTDRKTVPADARTATVKGLNASTTYQFQVEAYANGGRCGTVSSPEGPITATTSEQSEQGVPMAPVNRIELDLATADVSGAGTNQAVYLGIGGREFLVDSADSTNDFEQGDKKTYIFGEGSNIDQFQYNDPRAPKIHTTDVERYPMYVRAPNSDWAVADITVTVNPGDNELVYENASLASSNDVIWFGSTYGEVVYLARRTTAPSPKDPGEPEPEPQPEPQP